MLLVLTFLILITAFLIGIALIVTSYVATFAIAFSPIFLIRYFDRKGTKNTSKQLYLLTKVACGVVAILLSVQVFHISKPLNIRTANTWCEMAGAFDRTKHKLNRCKSKIEWLGSINDKKIDHFLSTQNLGTPKLINSEISLRKVYFDGEDVVFIYTLINHVSGNNANNELVQAKYNEDLAKACSSKKYRELLSKRYSFRYVFEDNDTKIITGRMVNISDCFNVKINVTTEHLTRSSNGQNMLSSFLQKHAKKLPSNLAV